jgi:hypothetical protein
MMKPQNQHETFPRYDLLWHDETAYCASPKLQNIFLHSDFLRT